MRPVEFTEIYKCLGDASRVRILNLLGSGPLCGCHFMEALGLDQVKISKHLNYMRRLGVLTAEREANWMIYRLAEPVPPLLTDNLASLLRYQEEALPFDEDNARLSAILKRLADEKQACPKSVSQSTLASACCLTTT
ncbi:metalloregulator ArsR/SmtB family transcription factor [bacterium]|nr:metalloregulator ArsR/SmtB family transcription factor [bacterium]